MGSVIRGLVRAKFCDPLEIIASEPSDQARAALKSEVGIRFATENAEVAERVEIILVGVKPPIVLSALKDISARI